MQTLTLLLTVQSKNAEWGGAKEAKRVIMEHRNKAQLRLPGPRVPLVADKTAIKIISIAAKLLKLNPPCSALFGNATALKAGTFVDSPEAEEMDRVFVSP